MNYEKQFGDGYPLNEEVFEELTESLCDHWSSIKRSDRYLRGTIKALENRSVRLENENRDLKRLIKKSESLRKKGA